ncbi:MAG: AMP-dependent synthetase [Deltaproteobacteria bacterium]|nr:MAG: AMP-dependent synthetase [Deltaproteobacteria bacterium]
MPGPADFRWSIPERFNIGVDVADRHAARGNDTALIEVDASGKVTTFGFRDVVRLANRLANLLRAEGIERGDRVAVLLPQRHETAIVHVAAYKAGFVAVPLFTLFGEEALEFRLQNGEARAIVTDAEGAAKIGRLRDRLPALKLVLCADGPADGAVDLHAAVERASDRFEAVDTDAEEPAVLIYTSGTTGQPKGALHAHRVLLGHLPGVEYPHDNFPQPGDRFWTPADWAWIGGLYDVLLPAWHHGVAVVAYRARKFVPGEALDLMARQGVRNVFMPPTALKLLRASGARNPGVRLRSLASGGESLGEDLIEWGRETFGLTINEFYGQTECNLVVGNGGGLPPVRPGWTGTAIPGHRVGIIDEEGRELPAGEMGSIAYRRPDPVMFLGYFANQAATAAKFRGDWMVSGDLGVRDDAGYFRFVGRDDDLITSGGYRIGPAEIETCLLRHPAVALAAVVGEPDPIRTEVVKAVIVLKPGHAGSPALAAELQEHVRSRLAAYEYPRIVEFVAELPLTATGKIIRRALRKAPATK